MGHARKLGDQVRGKVPLAVVRTSPAILKAMAKLDTCDQHILVDLDKPFVPNVDETWLGAEVRYFLNPHGYKGKSVCAWQTAGGASQRQRLGYGERLISMQEKAEYFALADDLGQAEAYVVETFDNDGWDDALVREPNILDWLVSTRRKPGEKRKLGFYQKLKREAQSKAVTEAKHYRPNERAAYHTFTTKLAEGEKMSDADWALELKRNKATSTAQSRRVAKAKLARIAAAEAKAQKAKDREPIVLVSVTKVTVGLRPGRSLVV